jgi:sugar-specific transcriptional regulator TrmB
LTILTKNERINAKIDELRQVFGDLDKNTQTTIEALINKAAFMSVTLDDLQTAINEKGVIEEYHNGANQSGYKKSVEVDVYNTMIKNYHAVMKQLIDLLPNKTDGQLAGESIRAFLGK